MQGEMKALSRSFILRIRFHRALARWQLGRLLLASAVTRQDRSALAEVARLEAKLLGEQVGFATTWAQLLSAGREKLAGNSQRSQSALEAALLSAERHELFQCQHAAGYFLARLRPDARSEPLARAAQSWAQQQQIAAPERFFSSFCPGF